MTMTARGRNKQESEIEFFVDNPLGSWRISILPRRPITVHSCKPNIWLSKFLTSRHVRMYREIFYTSNTLRKLMN